MSTTELFLLCKDMLSVKESSRYVTNYYSTIIHLMYMYIFTAVVAVCGTACEYQEVIFDCAVYVFVSMSVETFHKYLLKYSHVAIFRDRLDGSLRGMFMIDYKTNLSIDGRSYNCINVSAIKIKLDVLIFCLHVALFYSWE